jgi:long-chain acyl-CoA synthetase
MPGTDIKIVDLETGTRPLPQGEDGEIAISGPQVMKATGTAPRDRSGVPEIDGRRYFSPATSATWTTTGISSSPTAKRT